MKIAMEFVKAGQEWNPHTGRSSNYLVLAFAGRQFRVACSEEEMGHFISQAVGQEEGAPYEGPQDDAFAYGEYGEELDDEPIDEVIYDRKVAQRDVNGDLVFGGDLPEDQPVAAPVLFDVNDLPDAADMADAGPPQPTAVQQRKKMIKDAFAARPYRALLSEQERRLQALRAKAKLRPQRRVESDEQGNPIVPQEHRIQAEGPPSASTTQHTTAAGAQDDDLFAQG